MFHEDEVIDAEMFIHVRQAVTSDVCDSFVFMRLIISYGESP